MKRIFKVLYVLVFFLMSVFCFYNAYKIKSEQKEIEVEQQELIEIAEIPEEIEITSL